MRGDPDGTGGPHAFVADLDQPELDPDDRHHLARVVRLADGDPLTVADGQGRWRPCRFGPALEPVGPVVVVPAPDPSIGVAFAPVKGDRPEWVVQKLTEIGVDHIRPFLSARSVVRWSGARADAQVVRWRRVARAAAMQSRRSRLPEVHPIVSFAEVAGLAGASLAQRGGARPSLEHPLVLIGPEGGWDPAERSHGLPEVDLGDTVLRAETAALVASALMVARRGTVEDG